MNPEQPTTTTTTRTPRSRSRKPKVDPPAAALTGTGDTTGSETGTQGEPQQSATAAADGPTGAAQATAEGEGTGEGKNHEGQAGAADKGTEAPALHPPVASPAAGSTYATRGDRTMRTLQEKDPNGTPSQYQVKEITTRGLPVPPTYGAAQALLDSFPPTDPQLRRLKEIGLTAETRGQAKTVIAEYVAANPEVSQKWDAENAAASVQRRQAGRAEGEPRIATAGMFQLLAQSGVSPIPTDYAEAAALIDNLPPSPNMVELLKQYGRPVPATRAEAGEIIRGLPATSEQIISIMRQTNGKYAPKTRGDAETWFANNRRTRSGGGGRGGWQEMDVEDAGHRMAA